MLAPDEQLALDVLDALDMRCTPRLEPLLSRTDRQERFRLEQRCRMTAALVGWLERWMDEPHNERLRASGDPLWQAVSATHDHLVLSQRQLVQTAREMDEAASRLCQGMSGAGT